LKGTKENAFETIETIETIDSDRRRTSRNRVSSSARRVAPERALGKSGSPRLPAVQIALAIARRAEPQR
jgi:hypothetical protein